jgi:tRNA nucleotidyltransferase (CCA-adding enzyme)
MKKLLCGKNVSSILSEFSCVITKIFPELSSSIGFDQKSKYHIYDVYTHMVKSMEVSENNVLVRLSLLFHDCGKPYVYTTDDKGYRHFVGHQKKSSELAEMCLMRLKCDSKTIKTVCTLVLYHDFPLSCDKKSVKKLLSQVGFEEARLIVKIKYADMYSHGKEYVMTEETRDRLLSVIDEIEREKECVDVKTLAVCGDDLIAIGYKQGRVIGDTLNILLSDVMSEKIPNEKEKLLERARMLLSGIHKP